MVLLLCAALCAKFATRAPYVDEHQHHPYSYLRAGCVYVYVCTYSRCSRISCDVQTFCTRAYAGDAQACERDMCVCVCVPLVVKSINSSSYKFQLYKLAEAATVRTVCLV